MRARIAASLALAALLLLVALGAPAGAARAQVAASPQAAVHPAFTGQAMWIWQLSKTEGGNLARIAAKAKANGVSAVYVKSADAGLAWPQFSRGLVRTLRAAGLRVCAWQFVYGRLPVAEARAGAQAVRNGAECLIIDAESAYEGRYRSARRYLTTLRSVIGRDYPLGLTSFPYVDFHPNLPYSEFLGPTGAQVNLPQVYWKDIGDSVDESMSRTFRLNRVYGRPIHPIGQLYGAPRAAEVLRFRQVAAAYEAPGLSWWEWVSAPSLWGQLRKPLGNLGTGSLPDPGWPVLGPRAKGDLVVQAQWLLRRSGRRLKVTAVLDAATRRGLRGVQRRAGLRATGTLDGRTWQALLGGATPAPTPPTEGGGAGTSGTGGTAVAR